MKSRSERAAPTISVKYDTGTLLLKSWIVWVLSVNPKSTGTYAPVSSMFTAMTGIQPIQYIQFVMPLMCGYALGSRSLNA